MLKALAIGSFVVALGLSAERVAEGPQVGQPALDFELQDSQGNRYRLSELQGEKNVVLEFFRSGSW